MLYFKSCTICEGDLLLEADENRASIKCLGCGNQSAVPSNTHLFEVLCNERPPDGAGMTAGTPQAA